MNIPAVFAELGPVKVNRQGGVARDLALGRGARREHGRSPVTDEQRSPRAKERQPFGRGSPGRWAPLLTRHVAMAMLLVRALPNGPAIPRAIPAYLP